MADSPWKEEVAAGYPFAGAAGCVLDDVLKRSGTDRSQFVLTNSLNCCPPSLGWTDHPERYPEASAALARCRPYLDDLVNSLKPRVFLLLGGVALGRVVGASGIDRHAAYVVDTPYGIPAVPTYHPSYIMQGNRDLTPVLKFSVDRALEVAAAGWRRPQPLLLLDSPIDALQEYVRSLPPRIEELVVDVETYESPSLDEEELEGAGASFTIIRAGFSARDGEAVSFPWSPPYIGVMREVLGRSDLLIEHADNHFDTRRLRATGMPVPGRVASSLWAYHFLMPGLKKGLGKCAPFFWAGPPWKHLAAAEPAFYNAMDNLGARLVWGGSRRLLKAQGRWPVFERHCLEVDPILVKMGRAGIAVDRDRQRDFQKALEGKLDSVQKELNVSLPGGMARYKVWKRRPPKDMTGVEYYEEEVSDVLAEGEALDLSLFPVHGEPGYGRLQPAGERPGEGAGSVDGPASPGPDPSRTSKTTKIEKRWRRREPFNPNSGPQVAQLATCLGLKLPKSRSLKASAEAVTTEAKFLKRLARKDRRFRLILEARALGKMLTTYMWKPDERGRVTTVFGWHPSTWRKSSRYPNLQTIPKRQELAQGFRRMLVAAPEHMLVTADSTSIEAVLVGYFAQSSAFVRLAKAGVHGWLSAAWLGCPVPEDLPFAELKSRLKAVKNSDLPLYDRAKRVVYLSLFAGTPARIYEEYPDDFESEKQARELQELLFSSEAGRKIREWQRQVLKRAHQERFLDNPFGYRRYFYNVFTFDHQKHQKLLRAGVSRCEATNQAHRMGDDAKSVIAFLPQSTASAIQTEILLGIAAEDPWLLEWLRLVIHDELIAEPVESEAEKTAAALYRQFSRPWPQLGGLSIGVEVKIGRNLADHSLDNPSGMREWLPREA